MNQTDLFAKDMPRPKSYDKAIIQTAAESFGRKMAMTYSEWSPEEWAEDLVKVYASHKDGYELAKDLERHGYDPDSEMVGHLDDFGFEVSRVHREAVKTWVTSVGFEPAYSVDDHVEVKRSFSTDPNHGKITEIRHDSAEYLVRTNPESNSALVVAAEDIVGIFRN